ncbi:MAG TPA: glycosyltransferase, partial [Chloroflexota bacterium]
LLDEAIFMYFEDNDLCKRLRERGWRVDFVPSAAVWHFNRPSAADRARRERYYQGLERFYTRHYGSVAGSLIRVATQLKLAIGR